jgi:hypothetical protein
MSQCMDCAWTISGLYVHGDLGTLQQSIYHDQQASGFILKHAFTAKVNYIDSEIVHHRVGSIHSNA